MKKLLVVIVVLSSLWAGYWFVGSTAAKAGFENWFEARRADGWQAEYTDITLLGFPSRFDTTLKEPVLADPNTGLAWEAPFLQIFALSYKPHHIITAFADTQTIRTPKQRYDVASTGMRASMVMEPNTDLAFNRANLVSEALAITPEGFEPTRLDGLQVALTRVEGAQYRVAFNAWDISALEEGRPQPRLIKLHLAEAQWGDLQLEAAGELTVDRAGTPTGKLTIKARNWREIVALARATQAAPDVLLDQIEQALSLVAQLNGNAETLDIPLGFSNGFIKLGPVPIGAAPRLFIR